MIARSSSSYQARWLGTVIQDVHQCNGLCSHRQTSPRGGGGGVVATARLHVPSSSKMVVFELTPLTIPSRVTIASKLRVVDK